MNHRIQKSVLAGIIGTAVMTLIIMAAPMMGMPKMSPPNMLAGILGMPVAIGWIMHFMIGIIFALAYTYMIAAKLKVSNHFIKGAIFGVIAFVFAQIMMKLMGMIMPMPAMEGPMILAAIGSLMGHIIFGMAVAKTVGETYCSGEFCETKTS
ncbi:DUF6789 family protein [Aequorivita marina]|uniref:DUF6789 family protein n=1 Tax=Aequorivita marina TaxID=3073654 RepID=UPI0028764FF6|nr:DUF6789 family protein [Aequorivita sp. S2608]MDS1298416.1 hypothetical protein [Aequorivita sp. S2608]